MEHEGPNPQFNRQKRDTAAEKLTKLQDEYEARGQPSSDKMQPVLTHNETYPKLREQLKKRKSDADVSDIGKARKRAPGSKKRPRQAGQTQRGSRGRRDKNLTRVTKKRSQYGGCSKCSYSKIFRTKSCQFTNYITVINKRIGTEVLMAPMAVESPVPEPPTKNESVTSVPDSIGSNITSVSSLNSNYFMDQEPMVRSSKRK